MDGITQQQREALERLKKQNHRSKADERLYKYLEGKLHSGGVLTNGKKSNRKYEPIKESRGWYFVEYFTPISNNKFATLNLVILEEVNKIDIVNAMEKETENWLNRYPIPVFVSAFDDTGTLINVSEVKPCNHLIGFHEQDGKMCLHWRLLKDEELPNVALNHEYVDNLYSNLVFKTYADLDIERQKKRQRIKIGWYLIFIWLVIIPAIFAIVEFMSDWLSFVVLIYSLYKAVQKSLELLGKWPKTKRQKEKEEEDRLKDHYYYHCQRNPEGFERLKRENFEKMAIDEISKEAAVIAKTSSDVPG